MLVSSHLIAIVTAFRGTDDNGHQGRVARAGRGNGGTDLFAGRAGALIVARRRGGSDK